MKYRGNKTIFEYTATCAMAISFIYHVRNAYMEVNYLNIPHIQIVQMWFAATWQSIG